MTAFTFKLGALDLSQYVRVAPQDSMDPYGSGWQNPAFSDAAFAEGHPLLNTDIGNREMVWPLYVKGVASAGSSNYSTVVLADSPVGYWRMDASGSTETDLGSGAHNGTYANSPTTGVTGALSGTSDAAVTFASSSSQAMTAGLPTIVTNNYAIEAWVKLTNLTAQKTRFVSNGDTSVSGAGWGFGISDGTMASTGLVLTGNLNGGSNFSSGYTFSDTNYHHVVMTREAGTTKFYVDGVLQAGTSATAPSAPNVGLQVAKDIFNATFLSGTIDEISVYATALTSTQVTTHYNAGITALGAVIAKDNLHTLVAQINREIANPTSSPLRIEWKDAGATLSTFYDATFARLDPHFNYRLSDQDWGDLTLRVWCAPPYGHSATERIIATAAGTAPGLTASLIGVASPLTGDVAPQLRVTVNTSGEAVGAAGRGLIVSAPKVAGYVPFISAASFAGPHPSSALLGASGAPGSQALFSQGPLDSGPAARLGLSASMYAGRKRIFAAVLPRTYTRQAIWAADTARQPVGPTALVTRPDGFQIVDLGVINVATSTPTTEIGLYSGRVPQTASDGLFGKPPYSGAQASSGLGFAGVYVLPEDSMQAAIDQNAKPLTRSFFGASGAGTAPITNLIGDYGETWSGVNTASVFYGLNGMHMVMANNGIWSSVAPVRDFRVRTIVHFLQNAFSPISNIGMQFGIAPKYDASSDFLFGVIQRNGSQVAVAVDYGGNFGASLVLASVAGFPIGSSYNGLVVDLWRQDNKVTINAQWANGTGIAYVPSAGMTATTVPVASTGVTDSRVRTVGVPYLFESGASHLFSFAQFDELRSVAQPSETYRLTSVGADTPLRSPITGSGPNISLQGAVRGPMPSITASTVGITAIDWQLDGGPMNDPMGTQVQCRERFTYAR